MHRKSIKRIFALSVFAIIPLLAIALTSFYNNAIYLSHQTYIAEIEATILASKREYLRAVIERTIAAIEYERSLCQDLSRGEPGGGEGSSEICSDAFVREVIKNRIRNIYLPDHGYVWINEIRNMDGGDGYAIRLVHPNLPETEGMQLSTSIEDIRGNTPYLTELEGIKQNGEVFFEYWFKKMDSDSVGPKLTFAKFYKPYNWVVATGVYIDDVRTLIESRVASAKQQMLQQKRKAIYFSMGAALVALGLSLFFNRRIAVVLDFYEQRVAERETQLQAANNNLEAAVAERTQQAEDAEQHYRLLYDNAPVSLWLEDCNWINSKFAGLKRQGIEDFSDYFQKHPEFVTECAQNVRILDVNSAALELHNAKSKAELLESLTKTFTEESFRAFREGLIALANGQTQFRTDAVIKTFDGKRIDVRLELFIQPTDECWSRVYVALVNIEDRKRYEEELSRNRDELERQVQKRTAELGKIVKLMTGREIRMKELKEEILKLKKQIKGG
jgi:PAS domain-containing protein